MHKMFFWDTKITARLEPTQMPTENQHAVQFYKDDQSLAKTVAGFFSEGLEAGEPAVVIATPKHTKAIVRALSTHGHDVEALRQAGQLQTLDADKMLSTFMVGNTPDPVLFKNNVGDVIERLCHGRKP